MKDEYDFSKGIKNPYSKLIREQSAGMNDDKTVVASCLIDFLWDEEASVWVVTSKDVPGLALEGGSFEGLLERVRHAVPDLLRLNVGSPKAISYSYRIKRNGQVMCY